MVGFVADAGNVAVMVDVTTLGAAYGWRLSRRDMSPVVQKVHMWQSLGRDVNHAGPVDA